MAGKKFVFFEIPALVPAHYGSPQTQNFEDALAHAQGVASLASAIVEQVLAMRQPGRFAYRLRFLRLLQRPSGVERRRVNAGASAVSADFAPKLGAKDSAR